MRASAAGVETQTFERAEGLYEPAAVAWLDPPNREGGHGCAGLECLADTPLASRFCFWRGASGRRYIFSVYSASECPAFRDAILIAAVRDDLGRRRAVAVWEAGLFPEPVLARAIRDLRGYGARLEFHLHLLTSAGANRDAALADLVGEAA